MTDCRIGVVGAAGRMGRTLLRLASGTPGFRLAGGTERPEAPEIGSDLGRLAGIEPVGIVLGSDPEALFAACDAVVDFTTPAASLAHARIAAATGKAHIVGTTGMDAAAQAALAEAARQAPIVFSGNMSLGVNLIAELVTQVARALDPAWDIEIVEMHHRHKVDAPSGTALLLGRAAAEGRGVELEEAADRGRDGITGARRPGAIGFTALRGGDVVGEHSVIFATEGERIELAHKATSREIFARGALRAARWAAGRPPGLYSMKDVLGI
ncbi:MAG: 4-hydroxy-tetrahydrodipicolinate reductase [Rhodospirillaceae bacterium]|jgi:4-hydroxy-tetrahydrodipicolinate reductase|nr:4-hydroxy-tetrahydrodipicolinate reductase [Rhodospirillaceae bacterium]